jgi:hypothetical protein
MSVGFSRSGVYGRGFLSGPKRGGGGTVRRLSDVSVTGLGFGNVYSMSLTPFLQMTKGHFCINDVASLRYGCRLFRPESHWSSGPVEVQIFGVSFCRKAV